MAQARPAKFPSIPGVDAAGTVVAKGARVRRFAVGEKVYAYEFGNPQGGFYAEFATVDAEHVGRCPSASICVRRVPLRRPD